MVVPKISLTPASETEFKVIDAKGSTVYESKLGDKLELVPCFWFSSGYTPVVTGQCFGSASQQVDSFVLAMSGTTGKLTRRDTFKRVQPRFDKDTGEGGEVDEIDEGGDTLGSPIVSDATPPDVLNFGDSANDEQREL